MTTSSKRAGDGIVIRVRALRNHLFGGFDVDQFPFASPGIRSGNGGLSFQDEVRVFDGVLGIRIR